MPDTGRPNPLPHARTRARRAVASAAVALALVPAAARSAGEPLRPAPGERSAASAEPSPGTAGDARAPDAWWHDGRQRRPLWRDDRHVVEFPVTAAPAVDRKPVVPGTTHGAAGGPRIKSAGTPVATGMQQSPVFRDSASLGGVPRALPGGVLVTFAAPLDDAAARARLRAEGLVPVRPVVAGRIWLVASPPGVASLELASRLHDGGRYASVQPNWWQPRALK